MYLFIFNFKVAGKLQAKIFLNFFPLIYCYFSATLANGRELRIFVLL